MGAHIGAQKHVNCFD